MPVYEYVCVECQGRFARLVRGFSDPSDLQCPRCASQAVRRAISRVSVVRSEDARLDAMADSSMFNDLDENDPRSVARWAKKMGRELGDDLGGDWNEMVDQMIDEEMGGEGDNQTGSAASNDLGWG